MSFILGVLLFVVWCGRPKHTTKAQPKALPDDNLGARRRELLAWNYPPRRCGGPKPGGTL